MGDLQPLLGTEFGQLQTFVDAGLLSPADIYVAEMTCQSSGDTRFELLLITALAVRGLRLGQVCIVLSEIQERCVLDAVEEIDLAGLEWPAIIPWIQALRESPCVRVIDDLDEGRVTPLVYDGTRVYLDRYWLYELNLGKNLQSRSLATDGVVGAGERDDLEEILGRLFPHGADVGDRQREATRRALTSRISIIAGGPGTGKTHTVAKILAACYELRELHDRPIQVALIAPTGKAASRMTDALRREAAEIDSIPLQRAVLETTAQTIHRYLGSDAHGRFRHNHQNTVAADLIIVDEASMVSTALMAALFDAIRPSASVVLVGDPFQLASVEAGAVLDEIVGSSHRNRNGSPLAEKITFLDRIHRFGEHSAIGALAVAIREGDPDGVIDALRSSPIEEVRWVQPDDAAELNSVRAQLVDHASSVIEVAIRGDHRAALELAADWKVLCPTRFGEFGSYRWCEVIEQELRARHAGSEIGTGFYVGRPLLVLRNDYLNLVMNGDSGVVVMTAEGRRVAVGEGSAVRLLSPAQIEDAETWWSMTVHKSQGSEFGTVVVSLPERPSAVLSRELLYTAISRARRSLVLVGAESVIRAAVASDLSRSSGLRERLWG